MSLASPVIESPPIALQSPMAIPTVDDSKSVAWWRKNGASLSITGLTVAAAFIRFFHLSSPCLWYDEARVYYRICGSYADLLTCLRTDGFGPLHYELYWVLIQKLPHGFPGPVMMRLIPAISGTLMVPAIYFLARQLLPIRTALLTAGFTVCSAFLIFYSRDAKMYMETWLLVTAGMGSLLWWFRTGRWTAWLCWVAANAAACGVHATAFIALPISLLFLLTQKTMRWQKALIWLLGILVIAAGPIGYYEKFNLFADRVSDDWSDSGLKWIEIYNAGRTGPDLARYLGTTMLMGWEWPRGSSLPMIQPSRVNVPIALSIVLAVILVIGIYPWPQRWRIAPALDRPTEPRWRVLLWLSLWILVPGYGFYCRSIPGFASPLDWWDSLVNLLPDDVLQALREQQWPWVIIGITAGAVLMAMIRHPASRSLLLRGLEIFAVFLGVMIVLWGIHAACVPAAQAAAEAKNPWESVWVPRYIGVIWPPLAMVVAVLILRLPTKSFRISAISLFLGVNLFYGGARIFGRTEPPVDLMAADSFTAKSSGNRILSWFNLRQGQQAPGGANLLGECGVYYNQSVDPHPLSPAQFKIESGKLKRQAFLWPPVPGERDIPKTVQHLIVWNQFNPNEQPSKYEREMTGWQLTGDISYSVRDFWTWQDLARYRRREYTRVSAG